MVTVPVKILFRGDHLKSEALLGEANRVMYVLENMMQLRGLQQHRIRMAPYPGAMIVCSKVFNRRTIEIDTGGGGKKYFYKTQECLCTCSFAEGYILEIQQGNSAHIGAAQLYTVMACKKRTYVPIRNVLATDFTEYMRAQKVVLVAYNTFAFTCCSDGTGGGGATGCAPEKSRLDFHDDEWRTTFRILPWNAFPLAKWLNKKEYSGV
jgi:hypothetical protein